MERLIVLEDTDGTETREEEGVGPKRPALLSKPRPSSRTRWLSRELSLLLYFRSSALL